MKNKRTYLIGIVLTLTVFEVFGGQAQDSYNLLNMSGESLLVTVRYHPNTWLLGEDSIKKLCTNQGSIMFVATAPAHPYNFTPYTRKEKLETLLEYIKELVVYDLQENIIITLDDITEGSFPKGNNCNIIITPEMVEMGRKKHTEFVLE
jgi:hypothetical protein